MTKKISFQNILTFITLAVAIFTAVAVLLNNPVDGSDCRTEGIWSMGIRGAGSVGVGNENDLRTAVADPTSGDIILTADIILTSNGGGPLVISRGVTIDGGGNTLSPGSGFDGSDVVSIDSGSITIKNLTIKGQNTNGIIVGPGSRATIQYCTIAGIGGSGYGVNVEGNAQIMNTTIYGYSDGGGVRVDGATASADVMFSTIVWNEYGAVIEEGAFEIASSISINSTKEYYIGSGTGSKSWASANYNVFGDNFSGGGSFDAINATYKQVFDANEPANNGGPTYTIALVVSSDNPAISRVSNMSFFGWDFVHDQRGIKRPGAGKTKADSGAFETQGGVGPGPVIVGVTGVSLNKSATTIEEGKTEQLFAAVEPSNATNKGVTWSSDNTEIATVASDGTVMGVKSGDAAIITVKTDDGGFTATCAVTVSAKKIPVTGVTLNKPSATIAAGKTETLTATITPPTATNQKITWSSSSTEIAAVASNGTVMGIKSGDATITVKTDDGGFTATCAVKITGGPRNNPISVLSLNLFPGEVGILTSEIEGEWSSDNADLIDISVSPLASTSGVISATAVSNILYVRAKYIYGMATITLEIAPGETFTVPVYIQPKKIKEMNDRLASDDVSFNILSPDIFTSVDARVETDAPQLVCYEPTGKPAGVITVDISDTEKFPNVDMVYLPMNYAVRMTEAEIKRNAENVGRTIDTEKLLAADGTPGEESVKEFFNVFVIQKEIKQGARTNQLARLVGTGAKQIATPQELMASGSLRLSADSAARTLRIDFDYMVKDGDIEPYFGNVGERREIIIGDGERDRLIIDPLWTSARKGSAGDVDGGSGCNAAPFAPLALLLILAVSFRKR